MGKLVLTLKENQVIEIAGLKCFVRKYKDNSNQYRLYIEGDKSIRIDRTEEYVLPLDHEQKKKSDSK